MWIHPRLGVVVVALSFLALPVTAQQPKVKEEDGHLSPVLVKVVFTNDSSRNVMLLGVGFEGGNSFHTHTLGVQTDGGASKRRIWLDSIAAIEGTNTMRTRTSEFTIVLKDGKKIAAMFTGNDCSSEINPDYPQNDCRTLFTHNEDDGGQKIDLQKVKSVEFLGPARKDKAGNALFEHWRYSPYTGEKLAQ
jgi:hypothetical protein